MAKKKVKIKKTELTFEESLRALEQIVTKLESNESGLAEALACYESGIGHLQACYKLLDGAERKIELLTGVDASGNPISVPFDDEATESLEEKGAARSRRRSRPTKAAEVSSQGENTTEEDEADEGPLLF